MKYVLHFVLFTLAFNPIALCRAGDPIKLPSAPFIPPSNAPAKLNKDVWYIVANSQPLVLDWTSCGLATIKVTPKKGPLTIPASVAVGWTPDKDDPDVVTITDSFIYIVKGEISGDGILTITPGVNDLDKDGKQIPLDKSKIIKRAITVDAQSPQPPPLPQPIPPAPTPVDPLTASLQTAYNADTGSDKAIQLTKLIGIIANAVDVAKASGTVTSSKQLQDNIHNATQLVLKGGSQLTNTRVAIGAYLAPTMGNNQNMTDSLWSTASSQYAMIANALKGVKP